MKNLMFWSLSPFLGNNIDLRKQYVKVFTYLFVTFALYKNDHKLTNNLSLGEL